MAEEHEIIYGAYSMVLDYLDALWKDLQQDDMTAGAGQDVRRKDYEAITQAPPGPMAAALRQQFDTLYGPNEWTHQQTLHMARQWRDQNFQQTGPGGY
jgi:hypothetical protein